MSNIITFVINLSMSLPDAVTVIMPIAVIMSDTTNEIIKNLTPIFMNI